MRGKRAAGPPRGHHVLSWLKERGAIEPGDEEEIQAHAERSGRRIEDAVVETGKMEEGELLKVLAGRYGTRFVSTGRLTKATIDATTLARLPRELAERLGVFPVVYDERTQTLSIVVAAPGEDDVEKQVQVACKVREVRSYVARPAAIGAAIDKFYRGNVRAFAQIARRQRGPGLGFLDSAPRGGPSAELDDDFSDPFTDLMGPAPSSRRPTPLPPKRAPTQHARPPPAPGSGAAPLALDGTIPADDPPTGTAGVSPEAFVETIRVFVTLLEHDREELRGHSVRVAQTCARVASRVGMGADDVNALLVAAHLHDVGKGSSAHHLTALNVARLEAHRAQAQRTYLAPVKLFGSAGLPAESARILEHLYERWDGQGFPDRLAGKDIPYGARVLALVETYADLIANPKNPYRRVLSVPEALSVLRELGGQIFDPTLAEVLVQLAVGAQADASVGARQRALIVDPDPDETTVIELRLLEHGFVVDVARDYASATGKLASRPELVLTEVDLGGDPDGFELARRVAELDGAERPALIFLTARSDRDSVARGFDLGAADYLVKPASPELVAAKARQAVDGANQQKRRGVSGSLEEMSLPDVVQILSNGRRGGRLQITSGGQRGEIHFAEGQIFDARLGDRHGEEAFYAMLRLQDGTFTLDPSFTPAERVVHVSSEGLLLEGMRRLDEGLV